MRYKICELRTLFRFGDVMRFFLMLMEQQLVKEAKFAFVRAPSISSRGKDAEFTSPPKL